MTPIPVSDIITIGNPSDYKLHVARWNGYDQPLDVIYGPMAGEGGEIEVIVGSNGTVSCEATGSCWRA